MINSELQAAPQQRVSGVLKRVAFCMLTTSAWTQVLVATSTLAWGVNTPAHLVIIKGTEFFDAPTRRGAVSRSSSTLVFLPDHDLLVLRVITNDVLLPSSS